MAVTFRTLLAALSLMVASLALAAPSTPWQTPETFLADTDAFPAVHVLAAVPAPSEEAELAAEKRAFVALIVGASRVDLATREAEEYRDLKRAYRLELVAQAHHTRLAVLGP